jgi:hypothetical protein
LRRDRGRERKEQEEKKGLKREDLEEARGS